MSLSADLTTLWLLHDAGGVTAPQFTAAKRAAIAAAGPAGGGDPAATAVRVAAPRRATKGNSGEGMTLYVGDRCVELSPDATVEQLRSAAGLGKAGLTYAGTELTDGSAMLADLGIGAEARIDVLTAVALPTFDAALPHPSIEFGMDGTVATYKGSGGTATALSSEPVAAGRPWRFRIEHNPSNGYFGVGLSPIPQALSSLTSSRIASDGGGPGWSFNKNGCCYGPWAQDPFSGCREGVDPPLAKGDLVTFVVQKEPTAGEDINIDVTHQSVTRGERVRHGKIHVTDTPLYAAVFFCNTKGSQIRFVHPDVDPSDLPPLPDGEPPRPATPSSSGAEESEESEEEDDDEEPSGDLARLMSMGFDRKDAARALRRTGGDVPRAVDVLCGA